MAEEKQQRVRPQKLKFFRVLLSGFSRTLAIPQRLTEHFTRENLRSVTLLSPLRGAWDVRIGRDDGRGLHFAEGWERFAAAHGLSYGDLLVFKSVAGLAFFHVTIFDRTTCEVDYSLRNTGVAVSGDDRLPRSHESSYEEEDSQCFRKQATIPPSGERAPPMMEQESDEDQPQGSASCKRKRVQKPVHHMVKEATIQQVYKRSPYFEITICPKYKYAVGIPVKFVRSCIDLSNVHQMLLRDAPEGRLWPVKLHHYHQSNGHGGSFLLSTGWHDFCVSNNLKDGDVCMFKLKNKNEMLVQIRRSCRDGSRRQQAAPLKVATTALHQMRSPSKVTYAGPMMQFRSTIVPSNINKKGYLTIPRAFHEAVDLTSEKEVVLIDPSSRQWPVKIHYNDKRRWCGIGGRAWVAFYEENDLELGDVCLFKFKKKNEMLVQIISRSCRDGSRRRNKPLQQALNLKGATTTTLHHKRSPSKVTGVSNPADPLMRFRSTIVPTNVLKRGGYLTIPTAFLSSVHLSADEEVVLVDPSSRQWPVKIHYYSKPSQYRIRNGWVAFCEENDVEVGDVCIFSLEYRGGKGIFHVQVIKRQMLL